MTFEAVIFDADETIFNNQGIHLIVTGIILEDLGLSKDLVEEVHSKWDEFYFSEQTRVVEEVGFCIDRENAARSLVLALKVFGKEITLEEADEYWEYMRKEYSYRSKPYPDALNLIDFLDKKGIKMAIVSNGSKDIINKRLKNAGIEHHFEFVFAPCNEFPLTKPDMKIFHESLTKLNTKAEKTVFVGDNPNSDVMGANRVGMYSVLIDRYEVNDELVGLQVPNLKISSFEEMKNIFEE
ncbi:MAG: HAD family hydrolase [Asgard group archaeon]|nr:HAD family hydrolase [Asgard group archaeon]